MMYLLIWFIQFEINVIFISIETFDSTEQMNNKLSFKYPPDINQSLIHRKANQIFRNLDFKDSNLQRCSCCGRYVADQSSAPSICYDEAQLQFLGSGVILLFAFLKSQTLILLVLTFLLSLYAIMSNQLSEDIVILTDADFFSQFSLLNKDIHPTSHQIQIYLIFMMTIIWVFFNQIFIHRMRKAAFKADNHIQTPSDYAILINCLEDQTTKADIRAMVQKKCSQLSDEDKRQTQNLHIINIIIPLQLEQYYIQQEEEQQRFKTQIKLGTYETFQMAERQKPSKKTNKAIVIFQKQRSKDFFIQKYTICTWFKSYFCGIKRNSLDNQSTKIDIIRAPQPDDIIWRNLGRSDASIVVKKAITFGCGLILLLINGTIQYLFAKWSAYIENYYSSIVISFTSSIICIITDKFITVFIVRSTRKEGNITKTIQNSSLSLKIAAFQFFNSGVFYFLANALAVNFDIEALGKIFSSKVIIFMLLNAFSQPIVELLFDYFEIPNSFLRQLLKRELLIYTQKQCNELYELPDSGIPFKYAYIIRTVWLTFFFTPFVPVVSIISLFGFVLYYFICKYLFRHCYSIPFVRSSQVNTHSITILSFTPLALNSSQIIVLLSGITNFEISFQANIVVFISFSISILWIILPWFKINQTLFNFRANTNEKYSKNKFHFQTTYEMANPFYQGETMLRKDSQFLQYSFNEHMKKSNHQPKNVIQKQIMISRRHFPQNISSNRELLPQL